MALAVEKPPAQPAMGTHEVDMPDARTGMPRGAKRPPAEVSPQWSPEQDAAAVPLRNGPTPSLPGDLAAERTAESERSAQAQRKRGPAARPSPGRDGGGKGGGAPGGARPAP